MLAKDRKMTKRREKAKLSNMQVKEQSVAQNIPAHFDNSTDTFSLEAGKFCLDVAKLVFAGVILAGIMKEDADTTILYVIGVVVVMFFVFFGFYLIKHSKQKGR